MSRACNWVPNAADWAIIDALQRTLGVTGRADLMRLAIRALAAREQLEPPGGASEREAL